MSEEIFDVVNERDEVVGQAPRSEVHAKKLLHRAVHVLVFNSHGQLFLHRVLVPKQAVAVQAGPARANWLAGAVMVERTLSWVAVTPIAWP